MNRKIKREEKGRQRELLNENNALPKDNFPPTLMIQYTSC